MIPRHLLIGVAALLVLVIGPGLLRAILRDVELSVDELADLL